MATCTHEITTPDSGNSPNTSGAFTPATNDLLIVFVVASSETETTGTLTSSVGGFTFTQFDHAFYASSGNSIFAYVSDALVSSATSQTVTWTETSDTANGTAISVYAVAGMSRTGLSAIRQSLGADNQGTGTPTATFAASCLTGNPTLGVVGNNSNPAGLTFPTDWTEGSDTGYNTPTTGIETVFRNSGFTGTTITWGSSSATAHGLIIVELDTSAEGVSLTADPGALTAAGQAATVAVGLTATGGALVATGGTATLDVSLTASPGSLTLMGEAANLGGTASLVADPGALTLAGADASLDATSGVNVAGDPGALVATGATATFAVSLTATEGALALSGGTASTDVSLTAAAGALALTGGEATLDATAHVSLVADPGALALTGGEATLDVSGSASVQADPGALALTGAEATLEATETAPAAPEEITGGWEPFFRREQDALRRKAARLRKEREDEEREEAERERLAAAVEAALVADGAITQAQADLIRLRGLAAQYARSDIPRRAQRALDYAERAQSEMAVQLALREMQRIADEEELALLLILAAAA